MSMVTIDGVRYRVDDAKRRGLLREEPAAPAPVESEAAPEDVSPVDDDHKPSWWENVKGRTPKNKAAKPANK